MVRGDVAPWRRRVEYVDGVVEAPIEPLLPVLELTRGTPNWGWLMRRGTLEVSERDFTVIADRMGAASLVG